MSRREREPLPEAFRTALRAAREPKQCRDFMLAGHDEIAEAGAFGVPERHTPHFDFLDGIPAADWLECREIEKQMG